MNDMIKKFSSEQVKAARTRLDKSSKGSDKEYYTHLLETNMELNVLQILPIVRILKNIEQETVNARISLEQGGKYDWNEDLQECDNWLQQILNDIDILLKNINQSEGD